MYRSVLTLVMLGLAPATAVQAQAASDGSRAVVQPLPSPAVGELNSALRRISRNARDVDALLAAGSASLRLNDNEAAAGFYSRARDVEPRNAQAAVGLANAYLRSDRPVEALQLYREAEQAGASTQAMAADRGLAYDLVGENAAAQQEYARALTGAGGDEVRRRLALSQAIQGNREGFERTLYPLLEKQDFAAYRIRAFSLAILGQEKEAIAITEAVMPADLAARLAPYLNYMRRLTPAQQAAAANLGNFPRAAQIGRDDPRILAYREGKAGIGAADAALAPAGPALGASAAAAASTAPVLARNEPPAQRRRPGRGSGRVEEVAVSVPQKPVETVAAAAPTPKPTPAPAPTPLLAAAPPIPVAQAVQVTPSTVQPTVQAAVQPTVRAAVQPLPAPVVQAAARQVPAPVVQPPAQSAPSLAAASSAQPGFDLAQVGTASEATPAPASLLPASVAAAPAANPPSTLAPALAPAPAPARVADAFADLAGAATTSVARAPDAVDITRIKPPREVEAKPEEPAAKPAAKPAAAKPPAPPPHPSRHWVQLATGKDKAALRFDWRRFSGKAPDQLSKLQPHVAAWGQTNRLLAGPYDTTRAANAALAAIKKAGLDGFTFTSDAGQEVAPLK